MDTVYVKEINSLKQEITELKRRLEVEKEENKRLRNQLAESTGQMKPSIKGALAPAGTEEGKS